MERILGERREPPGPPMVVHQGQRGGRLFVKEQHSLLGDSVGEVCVSDDTREVSNSPTLDAFASKERAQLSRYMSWFKDDHALAMDAFLHDWDPVTYLFPPVPLLQKVIRKIKDQKVRAILVCPQ